MRKLYITLFLLGLIINVIVGVVEMYPGYMDAEYYLIGGMQLTDGAGFKEMVLWNYLDGLIVLPHPSHAYWMPLTSILAALGFLLGDDMLWGRLAFIFLGACIPPTTAFFSYSLGKEKKAALFTGMLGAFSGFYLPLISNTDTFGIYMLSGVAFLMLLNAVIGGEKRTKKDLFRFLILGMLSGVMHLSRADGILWLLIAFIGVGYFTIPAKRWGALLWFAGIVVVGYLVVMGPWILRNMTEFGSAFSPGGTKVLWLTNYDELFEYPADKLTFERWLGSGFPAILKARIWALGQNLQTTLAVQGLVFLFPLTILGFWQLRHMPLIKFAALGWVGVFVIMTVVFPFAGARGGFLHSGAAFQIVFWGVTATGLEAFVRWGQRTRKWPLRQSRTVFSIGLVVIAILVSGFVFLSRVVGNDWRLPIWGQSYRDYQSLGSYLDQMGVSDDAVIMINNPPGFFLAAGHPAVVIPNGGLETTLSVARSVHAEYLILESNHVEGMQFLYDQPEQQLEGIKHLNTIGTVHIFAFEAP